MNLSLDNEVGENAAKIVVLTPVKNESWILNQFLTVTSLFADCIIIADQQSTDDSVSICNRFEKVIVVPNPNEKYDEADRQLLLINKARDLFHGQKILLFTLDADEIISYQALQYNDIWNAMRLSKPGTSFSFEKPDILPGSAKCIRWKNNYFPLAYVDDGTVHSPQKIHSRRIPASKFGEDVKIDEIKILHFGFARPNVQSAKMRYYSMLENINNTSPFYRRRRIYRSYFDPYTFYSSANIQVVPETWIKGWMDWSVDLFNLEDPVYSWHCLKSLQLFYKYGSRRFHLDDIWDFEWKICLEHFKKLKFQDLPDTIDPPPFYIHFFGVITNVLANVISKIRHINK